MILTNCILLSKTQMEESCVKAKIVTKIDCIHIKLEKKNLFERNDL